MKHCPCCGYLKESNDKAVTLTREQFQRVRKGSILKSPKGTLRQVISLRKRTSEFVTFMKVCETGIKTNHTTTYAYNDIRKGYTLVKV
jgi:hypothetical protein